MTMHEQPGVIDIGLRYVFWGVRDPERFQNRSQNILKIL